MSGPFTCMRCLADTDNDCDICDECLEESRRDNQTADEPDRNANVAEPLRRNAMTPQAPK